MKELEQIIKQDSVYLHDWAKSERFGIVSDFEDVYLTREEYESPTPPFPNEKFWREKVGLMKDALEKYKDVNILFASYSYANYSGDAWVLFEQDGKLYEVSGSHCSCYGLEGQWSPEDVNLTELENRLTNGTFGEDDWCENEFKREICEFLGVEYMKNTK